MDPLFPDIQELLLEDDGRAEYCVEAAGSYDSEEWAVTRFSHSRAAAQELADALSKQKQFGCVRLYEWASFIRESARPSTGWVAFWWSDVEYVGQDPGRGWVIPEGMTRPIDSSRHSSREA